MTKVPHERNRGARLLIVGEAPGETEEQVGRPFMGKSGDLLNGVLLKCGMTRQQFVIANVCNYRPPGNKIEKAKPEWIKEGTEELLALIEEIKPLGIIVLGNTSLHALTGYREISSRRGSIYSYNGIPVVPTLHPAAVLRDTKSTVLFHHDIKRFKALLDGTLEKNLNRRLVINPTPDDLQVLSESFREGDVVACDIETDERALACVGFAPRPDYAVCIPATTPEYRAAIRELLGRNARWVFHNSPYDVAFLTHRCGYKLGGSIEDTLAQHQALHPEMPRDLATLTSMYTLQPYYKDMYTNWTNAKDYDEYYRYNGLDCCVTREIFSVLDRKLDVSGLRGVYESTRQLLGHAVGMSSLGLRYDAAAAKEIRDKTLAEIAALQAELDQLAGRSINVNSPKQVADLLYKDLKIPVKRNRDTGNATTAEKALMSLYAKIPSAEIRKVMELLFAIRHRRKFVSSYLNVRLSPDGRCRTSYNPAGTETGRWSASKFLITEGANLQTIPPAWKPCFIADDGMVLWMADYSQIEARFVAWMAEDLEQIEMFKSGRDIHRFNASRIFNVPYDEVTDEQRQIAKSCVHALNYGVGPQTLMETVNKKALETNFWLPLDMAKKVRSIYLEQFEAIVDWQEATWKEGKRTRTLTNPFGRKRIFLGSTSGVDNDTEHTKKEMIAFRPQSTVPDMINRAIVTLREHPPVEDFYVAMQVHDAIGGWGPAATIDTWAPAIKQAMDIPVNFPIGECRVPVDLKIGTRLSELTKWVAKS